MNEAFRLISLGCTGGPRENNLSSYLLSPIGCDEWITLDGGSLLGGIDAALEKSSLNDVGFTDKTLTRAGEFYLRRIKAYLFSHAHLDHIAGFILNSQSDENSKSILGIDPTIDNIRDFIFNGRIWPNYGDEGVDPMLKKYHYLRLLLHKKTEIPLTPMSVEAYLLSHPRGYPSTAFLVEHNDRYLLYFGDTSSDFLEIEKHLARIWLRIAPLVEAKKLHGIILECSHSETESDQTIFGHLDSRLMIKEFHHLEKIVGSSIEGLNVVVTHRKENLKAGPDMKGLIAEELARKNDLGLYLHFPCQGDRIIL